MAPQPIMQVKNSSTMQGTTEYGTGRLCILPPLKFKAFLTWQPSLSVCIDKQPLSCEPARNTNVYVRTV